jgi:iron complex outermembrane receptor protein
VTSPDTGAFKWIAGGNFFHKSLDTYDAYNLFQTPLIVERDYEHTTSYAGFFDATLKLSAGFSVIGGVRLTHDEKRMRFLSADLSLIGPFDTTSSDSWIEPSYRGVLNYQLDPYTLLYASYNHGYRSGAYDNGLKSSPQQLNPANPEFVNNYEVGAKTTLFDQRLRLSSAFYYMRFTDMQLDALAPIPGAICCNIVNAGVSRVYGAEVSGTALVSRDVSLNFVGTYSNAKFLQFNDDGVNYAGVRLGNIPTYKIRISPEYRMPYNNGNFFISPDATFVGPNRVHTIPDPYSRDIQKAFAILDAQAGYREDKWSVFGWVKNATNYRVLTGTDLETFFGYMNRIHGPPLSFGITVTTRY